jgi:hypothetical protein
MAEDERCYRRRFLAPIPITFLLAISANIGFAFSLYFFSIWQRKPAIGLLLTNGRIEPEALRVDSEIPRLTRRRLYVLMTGSPCAQGVNA